MSIINEFRFFSFRDNVSLIIGIIAGIGLGIWADYEWGIVGTAILGGFIGLFLGAGLREWLNSIFTLIVLFGIVYFVVDNRLDELKLFKDNQEILRKEQVYLQGWDSSVDLILRDFLNKSLPIYNQPFNNDILKNDMILYLRKESNSKLNVKDNFTIPKCKVDALISKGYNSSFDSKNLKYIIIEYFESEESGKYTDDSKGNIHIYNLYIIDFEKRKLVEHKIFRGGDPPILKNQYESGFGDPPTEEFNSYLKILFHISRFGCS